MLKMTQRTGLDPEKGIENYRAKLIGFFFFVFISYMYDIICDFLAAVMAT